MRTVALLVALVAGLAPAHTTGAFAEESPGPTAVTVIRDVPYGHRTAQQILDVHRVRRAVDDLAPALMLVHGGGWRAGDKQNFSPAADALARRGFVVFNVNYTLGAEGVPAYQKQVGDVRSALRWVGANAQRYGADRRRIALVGGSAGGYLVAMAATKERPPTPVRAVVSLSGPMNLTTLVAGLRERDRAAPTPCRGERCALVDTAVNDLQTLLGCHPFRCPDRDLELASPITYVDRNSPPFFLANGNAEVVPADQAREMAYKLRSRGVAVELEILPGDEHSAQYAGLIESSVLKFLDEHLAVASAPPNSPGGAAGQQMSPPRCWGVALLLLSGVAVAILVWWGARRRRRFPS